MEGFFEQRIFEMKQEDHILSSNQFQGAPSILQMTSIEKLNSLSKQIQKILASMTNEKINLLFMMRDDSKYIERTASKMLAKLEQAEKLVEKSKVLEQKAREELRLAEKLKPEIPAYVNRTKQLQISVRTVLSVEIEFLIITFLNRSREKSQRNTRTESLILWEGIKFCKNFPPF